VGWGGFLTTIFRHYNLQPTPKRRTCSNCKGPSTVQPQSTHNVLDFWSLKNCAEKSCVSLALLIHVPI